MSIFYNTCDICKHFSLFDRWCRYHERKERRDARACVHWEANEKLIERMQQQEREKLLQDIKDGRIDPRTDIEKVGCVLGGWAWVRFYDPDTHEYEIEITNMPWEPERKTIAVYKHRKEKQ